MTTTKRTFFIAALMSAAFDLVAVLASGQVYIPLSQREANWGGGSCVYASAVSQLRHVKAPKLASYVRRYFAGGENLGVWNNQLRDWGVSTRYTSNADKRLLDFAHTQKLTALITYHENHACLFKGWAIRNGRITHAYVLNPNHPNSIETPRYESFMRNWIRNDGEAIVVVPRRTTK